MINWFRKIIQKWKSNAGKLKTETYALFLAYQHPSTPWYAKVFTGIVVAYAFSPIDLIPDFIPILGYLDDLILVPLGIKFALKMIPPYVMKECRNRARTELSQKKPLNWIIVGIIVMIWIGLALLFFRWVKKLLR